MTDETLLDKIALSKRDQQAFARAEEALIKICAEQDINPMVSDSLQHMAFKIAKKAQAHKCGSYMLLAERALGLYVESYVDKAYTTGTTQEKDLLRIIAMGLAANDVKRQENPQSLLNGVAWVLSQGPSPYGQLFEQDKS